MKKMQLRIALAASIGAVLSLSGISTASADFVRSANQPVEISDSSVITTGTYIVRLTASPIATYDGGISGYEATSARANGDKRLNTKSSAAKNYQKYLRSQQRDVLATAGQKFGRELRPTFEYQHAINGFAVAMSAVEAKEMRKMAGVVSVQAERIEQLTTDSGPDWIGAPDIWDAIDGTMGEGLVVAILDSGINSDHPSFADVGDDGYNHANPLGSGNYIPGSYCDANPGFCNDKLIGAWDMVQTAADPGAPEDDDGHGSHTASTVAGNFVDDATLFAPTTSVAFDISGVAPHANIIAYDVCVDSCPGAALVAAVNQVIIDAGNLPNGIAALNYSISGGGDPYNDPVELGFLSAVEAGVYVSASAGNSGPDAGTVAHLGPWVSTTAASTHNREIRNELIDLESDGSDSADIAGLGLTDGYGPAPIIDSASLEGDFPGSTLCGLGSIGDNIPPWPPGTFNGEIVACTRGTFGRVEKGMNVLAAGAGGYVLMDTGGGVVSDAHVLPGVHISEADGVTLAAWIADNPNPQAEIRGYFLNQNPFNGDVMAGFSSRGPGTTLDVLKPDLTAPGVAIMGAEANGQAPAPEYQVISGTSMSSPHNAGSGALMTGVHPDWTPQEIKSAIMLTASTTFMVKETFAPADPFDMGAGRIDLGDAVDSTLVMDETISAFLKANPDTGGDPSILNVASMMDSNCVDTCTWGRRVSNAEDRTRSYILSLDGFDDYTIEYGTRRRKGGTDSESVTMRLRRNETANINVSLETAGMDDGWYFGQLNLLSVGIGAPNLHMPIAVYVSKASNPSAFTKTVDWDEVEDGDTVTYELTASNGQMAGPITVTDTLPDTLELVPASETSSVNGGSTSSPWAYDVGTRTLSWTGELDQGGLEVVPGSAPFGYFSLGDFGIAPLASGCNGDCDDGGYFFNVPPYTFNGATYTQALFSVNGTLEAGSASGVFTSFDNQNLPDSLTPNNIIAPFWRDLNQSAGGEMYIAVLSNGPSQWTIYEWENVPHFGSTDAVTMQVWVGNDGTPEEGIISFAYARMDNPAAGGTVGVENADGTIGDSYYYNGLGTAPAVGDDLVLDTVLGGSVTLGFDAIVDCTQDDDVIVNTGNLSNDGNSETAIAASVCEDDS